jgi:hypothetical protein
MRVVVLHESPAADTVAEDFCRAAETFNRGLDIRLRFLEVGFELRRLPIPAAGPAPSPLLEEMLRGFCPSMVLALGGGPGLLECAATAAKAGTALCVLPGPDRSGVALARIGRILVLLAGTEPPPALEDVTVHILEDDQPPGAAIVNILVRSAREIR